jgi:hypothetical protein
MNITRSTCPSMNITWSTCPSMHITWSTCPSMNITRCTHHIYGPRQFRYSFRYLCTVLNNSDTASGITHYTPLYHGNIPHYINLTIPVFHGPTLLYHGNIPHYINLTIPLFHCPTPLYHGNITHYINVTIQYFTAPSLYIKVILLII